MDFSAKGTYLNLDRADVFDHYLFKAHALVWHGKPETDTAKRDENMLTS